MRTKSDKEIADSAMAAFNTIVNNLGLMPKTPRFIYFRVSRKHVQIPGLLKKDDKFAYAYTTQRCSDGYFWVRIYKVKTTKSGESWTSVRKAHRRQRKKARALACAWYNKRVEALVKQLKKRQTLQTEKCHICNENLVTTEHFGVACCDQCLKELAEVENK
jgi:hypothetical protein